MASLLKNLALPFDDSKSYKFGDRFIFGGRLYQVLIPFSGTLDMTKVSEITLADLVKGGYPPCDNFSGASLEASAITTDNSNTYFSVPKAGYYNEDSKIFAENSNLANPLSIPSLTVGVSRYMGNGKTFDFTTDVSKYKKITIGAISGMYSNAGITFRIKGDSTDLKQHNVSYSADNSGSASIGSKLEYDISEYTTLTISNSATHGYGAYSLVTLSNIVLE